MKKALFITVTDIYDSNGNGGVKASQRNLRLIETIYGKNNVIVVSFPRKEYTTPPEGAVCFERTQNNFSHLIASIFGCKVYFPWSESKIFNYICKQDIDLLFIDSSILGRVSRINGSFKKIVFFHNSEADYAFNKVKNEGIQFYPSYWASKSNEKLAMKYADKVVCLNKRDQLRLCELYNRKADYILPITLSDTFDESEINNQYADRLLFVGAYMPQNVASIEWFIENVMPLLDNIELDIVGKGFEAKKSEYEKNKSIHVIGTVNDLGKQYYSHRVVVLPIIYGAGMKIKTAEAMMYGMRIVASDEALEGYRVNDIANIYRCDSPESYAISIKKALTSPPVYCKDVRTRFLDDYETSKVVNLFKDFIKGT